MKNKSISLVLVFIILISSLLSACQEAVTTTESGTTSDSITSDSTASNPVEDTPVVEASPVKIMTFNLRYDTTSHKLLSTEVRGANLMKLIQKYSPDSISFNEATDTWMKYLRGAMKQRGYEYVGVGRDKGKDSTDATGNGNEHCPVFYKATKYDLIDSGNFWLSDTPEVAGSTSWGAACKRICSYVVLKNKQSGEIYAHLSTHLDHESEEAKVNSISVIETYIRAIIEKHGNIGIILSGDFNTKINSEPYVSVTSYMDDSRFIATETGVVGSSTCGYQKPNQWEAGDKTTVDPSASPIDYIFVKKGAYTVNYYTIVDDTFTFDYGGQTWHDHPVSDHFGVYAEVALTNPSATFIKDEKNLISHGFGATYSTTCPDGLLPAYNTQLSITSSLPKLDQNDITNLLSPYGTRAIVTVNGDKHGYWEITINTTEKIYLSGLSFKTSNTTAPQLLKVFVMNSMNVWKQVGNTFDEEIESNTTYYLKTDQYLPTQTIKLVFYDTSTMSALTNITLYAKNNKPTS